MFQSHLSTHREKTSAHFSDAHRSRKSVVVQFRGYVNVVRTQKRLRNDSGPMSPKLCSDVQRQPQTTRHRPSFPRGDDDIPTNAATQALEKIVGYEAG